MGGMRKYTRRGTLVRADWLSTQGIKTKTAGTIKRARPLLALLYIDKLGRLPPILAHHEDRIAAVLERDGEREGASQLTLGQL